MVHSMGNTISFDEVINGDNLASNDVVNVKCCIDDLNIGIINTRKISVKAVITLTLSAEEMQDIDTVDEISDDSSVNYLRKKEQILQIVVNKKDSVL